MAKRTRRKKEARDDAVSVPDPAAKLTREHLECYGWAAADILRGSIDSSDDNTFEPLRDSGRRCRAPYDFRYSRRTCLIEPEVAAPH